MTGIAYEQSAEMAKKMGPFEKFKENTAYYKNTKCPENAKDTSLDNYWMSPANWM
jgi:hypothetical protein